MKFTSSDHRILRWLALVVGVTIGAALLVVVPFVRELASPIFGLDHDAMGTGRRPVVIIAGVTQQLPTTDYISSVGGVTANATAASTGDVEATTETVSTTFTEQGQVSFSGSIAPITFTGTQVDNYAPTGLATTYVIDQSVSSDTNITGLLAQPTGTQIDFRNLASSSGTLTFKTASGSSIATNRFTMSGAVDWKLPPGCSILFRYTGSDWRMIALITTDYPSLKTDGALTANGGASIVGGATADSFTAQALLGTTQASSSIGTQNDFAINASTTILRWTGASLVTFTGFTGGASGRLLIVINASGTQTLRLANLTTSSAGNQLINIASKDINLVGVNAAALYEYDGTASEWRMLSVFSTTIDYAITYSDGLTLSNALAGTTGAFTSGIVAQGTGAHYRTTISTGNGITCGTTPTTSMTDSAGKITIGTTSGGNCTMTFATTYTNPPMCIVRFEDAATNAASSYSTSATALSVTGASDGKTFDFFCVGLI